MNRALPVEYRPAVPGRHARALVVLLAAAGDDPQALAAGCAPPPGDGRDYLYVESALDGLGDGSLLTSLHGQWLAPLRDRHAHLLLGGLSIGGLLALVLADAQPALADAHLLIAPYPGNRALVAGLRAAGGPGPWLALPAPETLERRGWRGLQGLCAAGRPPWLGYGRADRYADGLQLMADDLPAARVRAIDGGHDWPTWRTLWALACNPPAMAIPS